MSPIVKEINIPYRNVVTELVLNGMDYTTGFRTHQRGVVVSVATHLFFGDPNVTESYENTLQEVANVEDFEKEFETSIVRVNFLNKDGSIGGIQVIRNPIIF